MTRSLLHQNSGLKLYYVPALVFIDSKALLFLYSTALFLIDCGAGTPIVVVWRGDGGDSEVQKCAAEVCSVTEASGVVVVVKLSISPSDLVGQTPQAPKDGRGRDDGAGGCWTKQDQDQREQHLPMKCTLVLLLQTVSVLRTVTSTTFPRSQIRKPRQPFKLEITWWLVNVNC